MLIASATAGSSSTCKAPLPFAVDGGIYFHFSRPTDTCVHALGYERFADPYDCRIYYECDDHVLNYQICDRHEYFDKDTLTCETGSAPSWCHISWDSSDGIPPRRMRRSAKPEADNLDEDCRDKLDGFRYASKRNCRSYAMCWQGKSLVGECARGFSFNDQSANDFCNLANNFRCEEDQMCPPTGIHMFRKLGSCTEYHFCFNGNLSTHHCAAGLEFDAAQNRCATEDVAKCLACPVVDDPQKPVMLAGFRCDE